MLILLLLLLFVEFISMRLERMRLRLLRDLLMEIEGRRVKYSR